MSKFYEPSEEAKSKFFEVFNRKTFPANVKFQFIGSEKQKGLIKVSKLADQYSFLLDKEILVSLNENLMDVFDNESVLILIEQEVDKISIDTQSGKIKLIQADLVTFSSLVSKYGIDKVTKANQIEDLYQQQVKDGEEEFIV